MGEGEREYSYQPKWSANAVVAAFFGLCAAVLGRKAALNDRALVINGSVELWAPGATTFYWMLTALCAAFAAAGAFFVYHRVVFRQRLLIGPASLTVPVSRWSRADLDIAYRDIRALSPRPIIGERFLDISYVGGKYSIPASMLPSKAAFEEVCELLTVKLRESQLPEQKQAEPHAAPDPAA